MSPHLLLKGFFFLLALNVTVAQAQPLTLEQAPVMAIVIDDIGDNRQRGMDAINLPGAITYAVLPHTPHSFELARTAHLFGKEVILHAPMENKAGLRLGPGALTASLSDQAFQKVLSDDLDAIPHAVGLNNHMGSLLTEDRHKMQQVMQIAKQRGLFFIDSMTTGRTVAWKVADAQGVPYLRRDVFLDNQQNWEYIHNQFKQALSKAVTEGHVVVIGHPYPETVAYLKEALPILRQLNIRLVTASELLKIRSQTRLLLTGETAKSHCDSQEGHCQTAPVAAKR